MNWLITQLDQRCDNVGESRPSSYRGRVAHILPDFKGTMRITGDASGPPG